jgi:signal transduction histidine kinase
MTRRLLVIDDDVALAKSLAAYFEDSGWLVEIAVKGADGIACIHRELPDVVLVDLNMPDISGLEVIVEASRCAVHLPIIVISGTVDLNDLLEATHLGAWDFVTKPVTSLAALEKTVMQSLERARLLKTNEIYRQHLEALVARDSVIFENSTVGIVFVDQAGRVSWRNGTSERLLGRELASGADFCKLLDLQLGNWAQLLPRIQKLETFRQTCCFRDPVAHEEFCDRFVQFEGKLVVESGEVCESVWILSDVTDQQRAEAEMQQTLMQQSELNMLRSRFVSMTSHEFRTPLAVIRSSLELLRDYRDRLPPEERGLLYGNIDNSVRRMTEMIDGMLLIGKTEAGREGFMPSFHDVTLLVSRFAQEVAQLQSEPQRLKISAFCTNPMVELDERYMAHIVTNLVGNAFKYSPQGGDVRVDIADADEHFSVSVSDQGIGIPQEDQSHLFETFCRARNVGNISGSGLGLAVVKRVVDMHHGHIAITSPLPGASDGTRVTVVLPRRQLQPLN